MVHPRLVDGRDSLQHWRLAANILNKHPRTNDKGWSSSLGVGRGANNPSQKKATKLRKRSMSLGPGKWNIRSLYRVGSLMTVEGTVQI
jgi:hypothetical protein